MKARWTEGNRFTLLENGEEFFPRVFECIAAAEHEVVLETFILFEDKVGKALHAALLTAARKGVRIDVTVDGYGSPDLSKAFISELTEAGVRFHIFDPSGRVFGMRTGVFRRMHRKIVVIDGVRAFVGGINYSADHLGDFGPEAKQDYAVEIEGPVVGEIHRFATSAIAPSGARRRWFRRRLPDVAMKPMPHQGDARALFVTRDNSEHRSDIERHYRIAIRLARREVIIANAYFFPGFRLLKEIRKAAKRGVTVRLILQGQPDMPIVKVAAHLLYDYLISGGVKIHEYCQRPLHGKVALVDDEWATVGSSNLDPLSLSLNLEANVIIRDAAFNEHLRERLNVLIQHHCTQVDASTVPQRNAWRASVSFFVFHFLRHFPYWARWLPAHVPRLTSIPLSRRARAAAGGTSPVGTGADRVTERQESS
ncbi:MAG: cardiolipin synthase [Rhizobacter sp.]|nr:cardiolipin synthase [Rhizobacter sp.]